MIFMLVSTTVVGLIPNCKPKRWLNQKAYVIAFRIMARSYIGSVAYHNKEYRPGNAGICVANHTTPMDVVVLSVDRDYCLVSYYNESFLKDHWFP